MGGLQYTICCWSLDLLSIGTACTTEQGHSRGQCGSGAVGQLGSGSLGEAPGEELGEHRGRVQPQNSEVPHPPLHIPLLVSSPHKVLCSRPPLAAAGTPPRAPQGVRPHGVRLDGSAGGGYIAGGVHVTQEDAIVVL